MKRLWVGMIVAVLLVVPATASEIAGGVAFMDAEEADDDVGANVRLSLDVGESWNIDLRASFFNGHGFVQPVRTVNIEATPIDLGLSYDFNPAGRVSPYVGGGVSYMLFKSSADNTVLGETEPSRVKDEPGWYALIGVKGPLGGRIGFYLEGVYRQVETDVQGDGLAAFDSISVDFAGAGAAAGLSFNW